jgi:Ku70/Ku80 beta-barrel domain
VPRPQIDQRFFDSPYYVTPNEPVGQEAFAVIREAMRGKGMVALGRLVLSKRERVIALEAYDKGLLGTTLRYPYEVRNAEDYFSDLADLAIAPEMLTLAEHILDSKAGAFDPTAFRDRYEQALLSHLQARQAGSVRERPRPSAAPQRVINLMEALRRSVTQDGKPRGLLDRQVARLLSLEDPAGIDASLTVRIRSTASVAHEAAGRGEHAGLVDRADHQSQDHEGTACRSASAANCSLRTEKNTSPPITSPPARSWTKVAKAVSMSRSVLALRTWSWSPSVRAAACRVLDRVSVLGLVGLTSSEVVPTATIMACSNSSSFGPISTFN